MNIVFLDGKYNVIPQEPTDLGWSVPEIYLYMQDFLKSKVIGGYAVGVPDVDDAYCFHLETPFWVVYFSERGQRFDPCFFRNWMDAAEVFIRKALGSVNAPSLLKWTRQDSTR